MLTISFLLFSFAVLTEYNLSHYKWMVSSEVDVLIKQKCQQNRFCLPIGRLFKLFCSKGSHEGAIEIIIGTKTDLGPVHRAKVIPVNEKSFRLAKYFCSVHMEKLYPTYRVNFLVVT
jgi:hypothetical protein